MREVEDQITWADVESAPPENGTYGDTLLRLLHDKHGIMDPLCLLEVGRGLLGDLLDIEIEDESPLDALLFALLLHAGHSVALAVENAVGWKTEGFEAGAIPDVMNALAERGFLVMSCDKREAAPAPIGWDGLKAEVERFRPGVLNARG